MGKGGVPILETSKGIERPLDQGNSTGPLGQSEIQENYRVKKQQIADLIQGDTRLEEGEKKEVLRKVGALIERDGRDLEKRLKTLSSARKNEAEGRRAAIYQEALGTLDQIQAGLKRQIDRAADFGMVTDSEFQEEINDQVDYLNSGIARLDNLSQAGIKAGKTPKEAMRSAVTNFLADPREQTIFNVQRIHNLYPSLALPEMIFSFASVNAPANESLRDLSGRIVRRTRPGESFHIIESLPPEGRYTYAKVADQSGRRYKLRLNSGGVTIQEYNRGTVQTVDALRPVERKPAKEEMSPMDHLVDHGYADPDGTLLRSVNALRIDQILPPEVQRATLIISNKLNSAKIQRGVPVTIVREGNTFFAEGDLKSAGRVKIYAGDQIQFSETQAPKLAETSTAPKSVAGQELREAYKGPQAKIAPSVAALLSYSKTMWRPINVIPEDLQGKAVCAAYVQRQLEAFYGIDFLKKSGLLDVSAKPPRLQDAWMMAFVLQERGFANTAVDMTSYFEVNSAKKSVRLDEGRGGYQRDVDRLLAAAAEPESQMGLLFFHYKHTKANPQILANLDQGGSLNSHAVLLLGQGVRRFEAKKAGETLGSAIIASIQDRLGKSYDNSWEKNRYMLGHLKRVTYGGRPVQFDGADFHYNDSSEVVVVEAGKMITYVDTQITDFYHNEYKKGESPARMVGLVEMMMQGNFEPVKLVQWDSKRVNTKIDHADVGDFIVAQWTMDPSVTDLKERIGQEYDRAPQVLRRNNPDRSEYIEKSIGYYVQIRAINDKTSLPPLSSILPILDYSQRSGEEKWAEIKDRTGRKATQLWSDLVS